VCAINTGKSLLVLWVSHWHTVKGSTEKRERMFLFIQDYAFF